MEGVKKGAESSEPNYDDCGNPIVNFSLHDDVEDGETPVAASQIDTKDIPTSPDNVQEGPKVNISKDTKDALELLELACSRSGIACTIQMRNQLKTIGKAESISEDNIVWYVRGIIMANQSMILPSITEAISELRSETRHLMNVSGQVSKTCTNLDKTSKLLMGSIDDSAKTVKDSFESTLKHVAQAYEEKLSSQSETKKPIETTTTIITPLPAPTKPVVIEAQAKEVSEQKPMDPSSSVASIDKVLEDKKRLLILVGISGKIMQALTDTNIHAMVTNELYAETLKVKMTPQVKAALKGIIMGNLTAHLNKLESRGKSTA